MRASICCLIAIMMLVGWANAEPYPTPTPETEPLTSASQEIAMLKAQNQALQEFQDGILNTLWSVIGMTVVVFGLLSYFQTKASEREVRSMMELATRPLREVSIEYAKLLLLSIRGSFVSEDDKEKIRDDLLRRLRDIQLSEEEMYIVMVREFPFICFEHILYIQLSFMKNLSIDQDAEFGEAMSAFISEHKARVEPPSPLYVRDFF